MTRVAAAGLMLVLAMGCSKDGPRPLSSQPPTSHPGTAIAPTTEQACRPPENPELQGGEHLIGDREPPVPYSSAPPTSGWHSSGAFDIGVQPPQDPLTEPEQVSVLEAGGVVITHNAIPDWAREALEERAARRYAGRVAVTSYEKLAPGEVVFSGWGVLQRCSGADLETLDRFVAKHADEQPANPGDK